MVEILGGPSSDMLKKGSEEFVGFEKKLPIPLESLFEGCDSNLIDLLKKCFAINPNLRASSHQLMKHEYFNSLKVLVSSDSFTTKGPLLMRRKSSVGETKKSI